MANRSGLFDPLALKLGWFDETEYPLGWFDPDFIGPTSAIDARVTWAQIRIPLGAAGNVKRWNGSTWEVVTVKRWNGSAWVAPTAVQRWNGAAWVGV